jgi:hypothetical protein
VETENFIVYFFVFLPPRLGVHGKDFRIAGRKLQGVRRGRRHPTCPPNPVGVVLPDPRIGRQNGTVPAQRAIGQRPHPGGCPVSISGKNQLTIEIPT